MNKPLSVLALLVVAACGARQDLPPTPAAATTRTIQHGDVVGLIADNGAHVWRGIPYADTAAGDNRWRAPRTVPEWPGTHEALQFADRCVQITNTLDQAEGLEPGLLIGSEDCLALDIYAPADADDLPVMVWIHGGGNVWGRSGAYDGSYLAKNENVIIVAVQYRLGPFGFFAHDAVRKSAKSRLDNTANFATLDLIAALEWVRDNVGAFGGDPGNVTIFGESAGGHNVVTLLASPFANGLFHRAIIQSGTFESVSLAVAEGTEGDHQNNASEIAQRLQARSAEELRAIPAYDFISAYTRGSTLLDLPRVIEDGVVLPARSLRDAFTSTETFNAVPIITGTNRDELKLFYASDRRMTEKRLWFFDVARDQSYYDVSSEYMSRIWHIRSVAEAATMLVTAGHTAVYAYRFDWDDGGRFLLTDLGKLLGAAHALEIPFVFNRFRLLGKADSVLFREQTLDERQQLSRAMGSYWASFARGGLPYAPGAPAWPSFDPQGRALLRFDAASDGGIELDTTNDSSALLIEDLADDSRISDDQRCDIVDEMTHWTFSMPLHAAASAATGCE